MKNQARLEWPLVLVTWEDSHSVPGGWRPLAEIVDDGSPTLCCSAGWLIQRNKEAITIVPHLSGGLQKNVRPYGRGGLTIPRSCVVKLQTLRR